MTLLIFITLIVSFVLPLEVKLLVSGRKLTSQGEEMRSSVKSLQLWGKSRGIAFKLDTAGDHYLFVELGYLKEKRNWP